MLGEGILWYVTWGGGGGGKLYDVSKHPLPRIEFRAKVEQLNILPLNIFGGRGVGLKISFACLLNFTFLFLKKASFKLNMILVVL